MCRNIKKLRSPERHPTDEELRNAALQFVRKVSGYHSPSRANEKAFNDAIEKVAASTREMFERLGVAPDTHPSGTHLNTNRSLTSTSSIKIDRESRKRRTVRVD